MEIGQQVAQLRKALDRLLEIGSSDYGVDCYCGSVEGPDEDAQCAVCEAYAVLEATK
jgi:hypothetical protein